ncbi:MAG: hypothetical protein HYY96_06990 [Candidatus Tectomicrobia bacterium]|nr:hypothetical protein [Candidatus Tectomicrobia bacterium]
MSSPYIAAIILGLLHGLEPGHGWPVAALWATQRRRAPLQGVLAGAVLSAFHLISSLAVVAAFILFARAFWLGNTALLRYAAAATLFGLAALSWRRANHHHPRERHPATLAEFAAFAFVLGFVHEEEFAVLALCASRPAGVGCFWLMLVYALAVSAAIMVLTLAALRALTRFERQRHLLEHRLPRVMAVVLALLGILSLLGWL